MRTPSLRWRVSLASLGVLALALTGVNVFVYATLHRSLFHNLDEVLRARADLVRSEDARVPPAELPARLMQLGLAATIVDPDGRAVPIDPASPRLGASLPSPPDDVGQQPVSRTVNLAGGRTAIVYARRTGTDHALATLVLVEAIGSGLALIAAALLLVRVCRSALRPLDEIAASARRVAAGSRGERLRPEQPGTTLGNLAAAYDAMLDDLETAIEATRAAQASSDEHLERTRRILETALDAYVAMDRTGRVVEWNQRAEELFGWARADILGAVVGETLVPPELRDGHVAVLARFLETGTGPLVGPRMELDALRRDGSRFAAEVTIWVTEDGDGPQFNAFVKDLSDRALGEEARRRLAAVVESAGDAIISHDLAGTILSWNDSAEMMYGYTSAEALGQSVEILRPPGAVDRGPDVVEMNRQGRPIQLVETVQRSKSGTLIDVALTMSPLLDRSGQVVGASIIARDVTEQRWMARTLDNTLAALESALEQAQRSDALSRRFLADAAHQLRSPITGIRACVETLLRGAPEHERDGLLVHVVREASRAGRLLSALLRLAELDQGAELATEPADLSLLCADEAARVQALAPHIQVVVEGAEDGRRLRQVDPDAVQDIIGNLLDNAARHAASRIEIAVRETDSGIEVRVVDDGPGLPPDRAEQAFERFVSLDGKGGSGLGLPIARALARAHGGDLTYVDGAFVLHIPLAASLGDGSPAVSLAGESPG